MRSYIRFVLFWFPALMMAIWGNTASAKTDFTILQGAGTISRSGHALVVSVSDDAVLESDRFDLPAGDSILIRQPSPASTLSIQIRDAGQSRICGAIRANGRIMMTNSGGILIGECASVEAKDFTASGGSGTVVNSGSLITRGGCIVLEGGEVRLGASSVLRAGGAENGISPGGVIRLVGNQALSDEAGSIIDVSGGKCGGDGGSVRICAPQINAIRSQFNGRASKGWTGGKLFLDPQNITLSATGSTATSGTVNETDPPTTGTLTLNPISLDSFSQILLQASQNITLATTWVVPDSATPTTLTLQAGNNIVFNNGDSLIVGQNWTVNLIAGASFNSATGVTANANSGHSSIVFSGSAGATSANGNLILIAGGAISTVTGAIQSTAGGSVLLQAVGQGISVGTMTLADTATPTSLTMQAVGNITATGGITAGQDWSLNLLAGATFGSTVSVNPSSSSSVTLSGGGTLQTQNGGINITAANAVTVNSGAIRTMNGGNIGVEAVNGSINTGQNNNGYIFNNNIYTTPQVSSSLGGISTAAGGNVTINAGGNVTSYLPTGTTTSDAGSGAFGPEPGVVTVTSGGSVYGHFVAADSETNGVPAPSAITAENGNAGSTSSMLSLSLATGSWFVNAPNGSIYLQEVRNPNGALNDSGYGAYALLNNVFNYDPLASVTLNAGNAVNLTGSSIPRPSGEPMLPCVYPPSATINAGLGVSLNNNVTLFPSTSGQLTVNATSFAGNGYTLAMSDSGATRWIEGTTDFATDHAPTPVQLNNAQPVVLNISNDLDNVTLVMPKETQIMAGGNMNNVSFTGQNLHTNDVSFFQVAGRILYPGNYAFVALTNSLALPPPLYPGAAQSYLQVLQNAVVPASGPGSPNAGALFPTLDLFYLPATCQLGYYGVMSASTESLLLGTLQEETFTSGGQAILDTNGDYVTTNATFGVNASTIMSLYTASQSSLGAAYPPQGIVIGGPGQLDITAQSMDLGASVQGVTSVGPANNNALATLAGQGATIHINLTGDLNMLASMISSWYGSAIDINVGGSANIGVAGLPSQQGLVPYGIWTSGGSDISVLAQGNVNVAISRIAAFNGGNVFVESLDGAVNVETNNLNEILITDVVVNPQTGVVSTLGQLVVGNGIVASAFEAIALNGTSQTVVAGTNLVLAVTANGTSPFAFQWYKNGSLLQASANASLSLPNVRRCDAGTYTVTVSNASTNTTLAIQLRVLVPQRINPPLMQSNGAVFISFGDYDGGILSAQDATTFIVQASADLVNWVTLTDAIIPAGNGQLGFADNLQTIPPPVYFRVSEQ